MNMPYTPLSASLPEGAFPEGLFGSDTSFLDHIAVLYYDEGGSAVDPRADDDDEQFSVFIRAKVMAEARVPLPFLAGCELIFGEGETADTGLIDIELSATTYPDDPPDLRLRIRTTVLSLGISREVLTPVETQLVGGEIEVTELAGNVGIPLPFDLLIEYVDEDWTIDFDVPAGAETSLALPLCAIGDSGVLIEATGVSLNLTGAGARPDGAPEGWVGLFLGQVDVYLPEVFNGTLSATGLGIGTGGVYGTIGATFPLAFNEGTQIFSGDLVTPVLGMDGGIESVAISFTQNVPTEFELGAQMLVPFFERPIAVVLSIDVAGAVTARLAGDDGLTTLEIDDVLSLTIDSLGFGYQHGTFSVSVGGDLTPQFVGLDWPTFAVEELSIDSEGNVKLEGGWLNLQDQYAFSFYGFTFEVTQLGFGSADDGGRWVGFSGGLKLVDGFSAGASVEGLRLTWYDDERDSKITFNGVGVEFEVPGAIRFKGSVSFNELPGPVRRFDGDIQLELLAIGLEIDAKLVVGTATDPATGDEYSFFAVYLGVELPAGIPLWTTGLALYGMAGLVAINMAPNKGAAPNALHPGSREDELWYENPDGSPGWYKRDTIGVTDLKSKWDPLDGSLALGAGITLGTLPDNGFTFNGSLLLVLSFPGPIILIEGKANLLKERAELGDDPNFRALAVLDFRGGTFLFGLDAKYVYGDGGQLIDIRGNVEAYFDVNDPTNWHLYLGQREPRSKRIKAEILNLWESNSYFMLDARKVQTGAWVGYGEDWRFGPLRLVVEAWLEGNVILSWDPGYFHGDVWAHGKIELSVFGFGLGLSLDARIAVDVFDPFHLLGSFSAGINLPWPLPDLSVSVELEWGPEPGVPPLPLPTSEVAVEHFKVTTSWPLPRGELLLPNYDGGGGYVADPLPSDAGALPPPAGSPIVPLDARPHITFAHSVHDDALIGVNPQPVNPPFERIGDPEKDEGPMKVTYRLTEVTLDSWSGGGWSTVARKAEGPNPAGVTELFGSWAPLPSLPSGDTTPGTDLPTANTKLWLWSKTPFDYTRHGGRSWDEWFDDAFDQYPCIPPAPEREICCSFDAMIGPITFGVMQLWQICEDLPGVIVAGSANVKVRQFDPPRNGYTHGVCVDDVDQMPGAMQFNFSAMPALEVRLRLAPTPGPSERCVQVSTQFEDPLTLFTVAGVSVDLGGESPAIGSIGGTGGLNLGGGAAFGLPCPATSVSVTVAMGTRESQIIALDGVNQVVGQAPVGGSGDSETHTFTAEGIASIEILNPGHEGVLATLCFTCVDAPPVVLAWAADGGGAIVATASPVGDEVILAPADPDPDSPVSIETVSLLGSTSFCLLEICVRIPANADEIEDREEMAQHLQDSLAHWSDVGEVLEPDTDYRVRVVTSVAAQGEGELSGLDQTTELIEFSYFRTQGPPGLTALSEPVNHPPDETFLSGLEDLRRYVDQTVPATVPAAGDKPVLPRPVYRAYDVGVKFNEDYVDLLYRIASRDLAVYLYDTNSQPVRDPAGRLIVAGNQWGRAEQAHLSQSAVRWIRRIKEATCAEFDQQIPLGRTLIDGASRVLNPDIVYEARLVPLLLREGFANGIGQWTVVDQGAISGPSQWQTVGHDDLTGAGATAAGVVVSLNAPTDLADVDPTVDFIVLADDTARPDGRYRIIAVNNGADTVTVDGAPVLSGGSSGWEIPAWHAAVQLTNIYGGSTVGSDPIKPGTMLIRGDADWTEYRLTTTLRSADNDAVGVVFRYQDEQNYYRWSMDAQRSYRRLTRVLGGVHTVLYADGETYASDTDYVVTVEAIGSDIRIYQDGEPVVAVTDGALSQGRIGLYCWASEGARFSDVAVDDFSDSSVVVYAFQFTTSMFTNFVHHLHSFNDRPWATEPEEGDLAAERAEAVGLAADPTDEEHRAFDRAAVKMFGGGAHQGVKRTEAHWVSADAGDVLAVRTPEPIDWSRVSVTVEHAAIGDPARVRPGSLKILGVTRAAGVAGDPNAEIVHLLARDEMDLAGWEIQRLQGSAGPIVISTDVLNASLNTSIDGIATLNLPAAPDAGPIVGLPGAPDTVPSVGLSIPVWVTHYQFADTYVVPGGSAIDLHSGPPDSAPEARPNVDQRHVAMIGSSGSNHFAGHQPVNLRLIDPTGTPGHRSLLLPDSAYVTVSSVAVLRKRDGTDFIMVPTGGTEFSFGRYRLRFRYRRDNTAADPTSLLLRQAGSSADEVAVLDIIKELHQA